MVVAPPGYSFYPVIPVVKIAANTVTCEKLRDHTEFFVGTIMEGTETLPAAGQRLFAEIFVFASGRLTKEEISG